MDNGGCSNPCLQCQRHTCSGQLLYAADSRRRGTIIYDANSCSSGGLDVRIRSSQGQQLRKKAYLKFALIKSARLSGVRRRMVDENFSELDNSFTLWQDKV
jgi:hypothetical protein